jgi:uncharacterized protein
MMRERPRRGSWLTSAFFVAATLEPLGLAAGGARAECVGAACARLALTHMKTDPPRAAQLFEESCNDGHAQGCAVTGELHAKGMGVPQDAAKAADFYQRACNSSAAFCGELGLAYLQGIGVRKDLARGETLLRKTCDADVPVACSNLALLLLKRDDAKAAARLYDKACSRGHGNACDFLGLLYAAGRGVAIDQGRARALKEKACAAGVPNACQDLQDRK